jgi:uncharacterized protein YjbI with pentapeptide repeats
VAWVESGGLSGWLRHAGLAGPPEGISEADPKPVQGVQADLLGCDLRGRDLRGWKLPGAILERSELGGAQLQGADLAYTRLRQAILRDAKLGNATLYQADLKAADLRRVDGVQCDAGAPDFTGAELQSADLRQADLATARGLTFASLAGSVLTDSKLPESVAKFDAPLGQLVETSKNASLAFVAMLAACGYSWLTIASTKDIGLIKNTSTSPLPLAGTDVPIAGFYWIAPLVLVGAYAYLHLYLVRLWQGLSNLPAVFPDGVTLDRKAYPWLLNGLVRNHFDRLRQDQTMVGRVEVWVSMFLAWWLVPISLLGFWGRYLMRHDWAGTNLHIFILMLSVIAGLLFYRIMCETFRPGTGPEAMERGNVVIFGIVVIAAILTLILAVRGTESGWWAPKAMLTLGLIAMSFGMFGAATWIARRIRRLGALPGATLAGALLFAMSVGGIEGHKSGFTSSSSPFYTLGLSTVTADAFASLGFTTNAVMAGEDVSTKPSNWTGLSTNAAKELAQVKGARLAFAHLRFADAERAFLANADLHFADLRDANLRFADLRQANLSGADLRNADLSFARLQGADLSQARLEYAELNGTNFTAANLSDANLTRADLIFTQFARADLNNIDMRGLPPSSIDFLKGACVGAPWRQPKFPQTDEYKALVLPHCPPSPEVLELDSPDSDLSDSR